MATLVVLVEGGRLGGSEGSVVIATEYAWFEPSGGEESKDASEVIYKCVLIARLDWVVEDVFAACVPEADEMFVSVCTHRADGSHIIVADAFTDLSSFVIGGREIGDGVTLRGVNLDWE